MADAMTAAADAAAAAAVAATLTATVAAVTAMGRKAHQQLARRQNLAGTAKR